MVIKTSSEAAAPWLIQTTNTHEWTRIMTATSVVLRPLLGRLSHLHLISLDTSFIIIDLSLEFAGFDPGSMYNALIALYNQCTEPHQMMLGTLAKIVEDRGE
ncbi:hypothetical protein [Nitrosomonas sp. ANs5]|uniref:hypothetical protein n=1 Tax=Nitrosomonas sp. ANs5 TaxID=3423941 RepID=UPI003D34B07B